MGRWRAAPEGLNRTRLRRWPVLPFTEVCPPHSWGGGAHAGGAEPNPITPLACPPPFTEVCSPHSWGGGGKAAGGAEPNPIRPLALSSPFMGRWRAAPEGLNRAQITRWPEGLNRTRLSRGIC